MGLVFHAAFGIFFTPVDMNTWCNQRHNVPYVFPETQRSDNFTPAAGIVAVISTSRRPCWARRPSALPLRNQRAATIHRGNGAVRSKRVWALKQPWSGYLGSHGLHLQRSRLINNAAPGPGAIGPRRPFKTLSFLPGMVLPDNITVANTTFPVSGIIFWRIPRKAGMTPGMSTFEDVLAAAGPSWLTIHCRRILATLRIFVRLC